MISINHNFLFVHVPKTAGNSIQHILIKYSDEKKVKNKTADDDSNHYGIINESYPVLKKHSTLLEYSKSLDPAIFSALYKFSVIRNPWDWCVSWYFHRNLRTWDKDEFIRFIKNMPCLSDYISLTNRFEYVVNKSCRKFGLNKRVGVSSLKQDVDFLIRFEHLNEDFGKVCNSIGLANNQLPHVNKSSRGLYTEYYDDKSRSIVKDKFRMEIEYANYQFGN